MDKHWLDCDIEAEYFGEERKKAKQERKQKKATDRSQYKKTDRSKLIAKKEGVQAKALEEEGLLRGRVLSIQSDQIHVDHEGALYICQLRGLLKKEKGEDKNLVTVGDFVYFKPLKDLEGSIVSIEKRTSFLARADNLSRRKQQLIAANIDLVLITLSVVSPPLKAFLADRYIIATEKGGMQPVIVVNKIDLLDKATDEERALFDEFTKGYLSTDIPVIAVSTVTGEGLDALKKIMQGKASVFSGQSGVGKSSLINAVTGLHLKVGETVLQTKKGSHTTTRPQLIPLPFGGFCIDTPGIKSFGVWNLDKAEVEAYFEEIHSLGAGCKFPDCHHYQETSCKVKEAVENGTLSALRYLSYLSLVETIEAVHLRR